MSRRLAASYVVIAGLSLTVAGLTSGVFGTAASGVCTPTTAGAGQSGGAGGAGGAGGVRCPKTTTTGTPHDEVGSTIIIGSTIVVVTLTN